MRIRFTWQPDSDEIDIDPQEVAEHYGTYKGAGTDAAIDWIHQDQPARLEINQDDVAALEAAVQEHLE